MIINPGNELLTDAKDYYVTDTDDCTSELVSFDDIKKAYWRGIQFEGLVVKHTRNGFQFRSGMVDSGFENKVLMFGTDNFIYLQKGYKYLGTTLVDCLGIYFCNYFYMLDVTNVSVFRFIAPDELLLKLNVRTLKQGSSYADYNRRQLTIDRYGEIKIRGMKSVKGKLCSLSEAKRVMIGALL